MPAVEPSIERYEFFVEGMHCASCVQRIEQAVRRLPGIVEARVNPGTSTAVIRYLTGQVRPIELRRAIERTGPYRAVQLEPRRGTAVAQTDYWARHEEPFKLRMGVCAGLSALVAAITWHLLPVSETAQVVRLMQWLLFGCASVIQWWGGWPFHLGAVLSLRRGAADMNTLISLGSFAAYAASVVSTVAPSWLVWAGLEPQFYYETSSFIITFILVGRWFEARAKRTAGDALKALLRLQPTHARVVRGDRERRIPVEELRVGDLFVLRPGDRVPVDGVVEEGRSYANEATMTGEATPREKRPGDRVLSGTQNLRGRLVCRAARIGRDTTLSQVFQLIEDAQSAKVPAQQLADRVAAVFVPVVMVIACLAFLGWSLWGPEPGKLAWAIASAVAVLIVACPCTLGLATPLAVMLGVGRGAHLGILLRNPAALELAGRVTDIVFDKTGTVTTGTLQVTGMQPSDGPLADETLALAAAAERASEHPVGAAIVQCAEARRVPRLHVGAFEALPGEGIKATVGQHEVLIGTPRLMEQSQVAWRTLSAPAQTAAQDVTSPPAGPALRAAGEAPPPAAASAGGRVMTVAIAVDRQVRLLVQVADAVKPDAKETIETLRHRGVTPHLVTGDQEDVARAVGQAVGIAQVKAQCLPQDKVAYIQALRQQGKIVAMVGDGMNDAAAMVHAHLSMAMGQSADITAETGDIILLHPHLRGVVAAIDLSRQVTRVIRQNLWWAFGYNAVTIPLAAGLFYPLWRIMLPPIIAGAAMAGSSLSVVFNSLRLKYPSRR